MFGAHVLRTPSKLRSLPRECVGPPRPCHGLQRPYSVAEEWELDMRALTLRLGPRTRPHVAVTRLARRCGTRHSDVPCNMQDAYLRKLPSRHVVLLFASSEAPGCHKRVACGSVDLRARCMLQCNQAQLCHPLLWTPLRVRTPSRASTPWPRVAAAAGLRAGAAAARRAPATTPPRG